MVEVRVKAKIASALDEMLVRRGKLPKEDARVYIADAMVDTGAVRSVLPSHVAQLLGLEIRSNRVVEYADGRKETVGVTESVIIEIDGRDTLEEALVLGDEVLIGQTVLEKIDMFVDCTGRRLIPNPTTPINR